MKFIRSLGSLFARRREGLYLGRKFTADVAFAFRMGAGMVGDVNRTHPATIEPTLIDVNAPPTLWGQAVVIDPATQGIRPLVIGDIALTDVYGFTARAWPTQQSSGTNFGEALLGGGGPPASGVIDTMRGGYIMVQLQNFVAQPSKKGGAVFVWVAASAGQHVQGGLEAVASGGNTMAITSTKTTFNGSPDPTGVVELAFNI